MAKELDNAASHTIHELEDLGPLLRERRKSLAMTQAQAAALAGISTRLWSECETGRRPGVSLDVVIRMLQIVGLDLHVVPRVSIRRPWVPPSAESQ